MPDNTTANEIMLRNANNDSTVTISSNGIICNSGIRGSIINDEPISYTFNVDSSSFISDSRDNSIGVDCAPSSDWSNNSATTIYKHIHSYNYIPQYIFHKISDEEELYLGAEIEIDNGGKSDDNAKYVIDIMGESNIFCKHDGSLNAGFEIVTHPCTFEYHKTLPYNNLFKWLTDNNYRAHDTTTCGLHIHFNKNYLGKDKLYQDLAISNLLYLFEKYWNKVVLIARRNSNRFASRFNLLENETAIDIYSKCKNASKYSSINLCHKDTVEIRIFKGTLNYNTYISTLEFVKSIVQLSKEISIYEIQEITWDNIYNRFSDSLKKYVDSKKKMPKEEKIVQNDGISFTGGYGSNQIFGMDYSGYSTINALREISARFMSAQEFTNVPQVTTLHDQIIDLRQRIRRERNPLSQRNLQRELGRLEREESQQRRNRH
jgi:hypothetical protein